jgi:hypothetical protein
MFLNIDSYAGGRRLWQHSELPANHISDAQASVVTKLIVHHRCFLPTASVRWKLLVFEALPTCHVSLFAVLLRRLSCR